MSKLIQKEVKFLENSKGIFYTSSWAKERSIKFLGLDENKIFITKQGGNIPTEKSQSLIKTTGVLKFVFISTDFNKKGGEIALSFVKRLNKIMSAELIIYGSPPTIKIDNSNMYYRGWINKDNKIAIAIREVKN